MIQIISLLLLMVNSLPGSSGTFTVEDSDVYNPLKNTGSIDEEELSNERKLLLEDEFKDNDTRKQYIIPPRYHYHPRLSWSPPIRSWSPPIRSWSPPLRSPYLRKMTIDGDTEKTDNGRKQARFFPGYPYFPPYPYPNPVDPYHWVERH